MSVTRTLRRTMIRNITERLYSAVPQETLYHYTTFAGLIGIVEGKAIWASEIRYMNDSAEMRHTVDLIAAKVGERVNLGNGKQKVLSHFLDWVSNRITQGHMLFAASFRSSGNLLSQWRGYSSVGQGVSIGFDPDYIMACAERQSSQLGKCIYDPLEQDRLIGEVLDEVQRLASSVDERSDDKAVQPSQAYHHIFEQIESDLLRIAAILKHPSFKEEEEWRIVSPVFSGYVAAPVLFREGASMLVPYIELPLTKDPPEPIRLDQVYLGPSPNSVLSLNSLTMFLTKQGVSVARGIQYCQIPFRQR